MSEEPVKPAAPLNGEAPPSSGLPAPVPSPPQQSTFPLQALEKVLAALRFYSPLPLPALPFERAPHTPLDLGTAPPWIALAGAILGFISAAVLLFADWIGLPSLLTAALTIASLALITGALHEDALADSVDGLFGGTTREQRLTIMRDSRVGSFAAVTLVLTLMLRVTALVALIDGLGPGGAGLAILAIASMSRIAGLVPSWLLPPARADGAGATAGRPGTGAMLQGTATTLAVTFAALWFTALPWLAAPLMAAVAFAAAWGVTRVAAHKIGGQTGDIAGAAQQIAEVAMLITLAAVAGGPLR